MAHGTRFGRLAALVLVAPAVGLAVSSIAFAQGSPPGATAKAPPVGSAKASAAPTSDTPTAGAGASFTKLATSTDGLTADAAAARAAKTSKSTKVDEAKLRAAGAQVDAAWDAYLPRLTFTGRYTRLSPIDPPVLGAPGFSSVSVAQGPGPIPDVTKASLFATPGFSFPVILNQYLLQASLLVPLSDYAFRIYHAHDAALANAEAVKWNAKVNVAQTAADARVAFYNVLRARGGVIIARSAVAQSAAHLKELKVRLVLKDTTVADVSRVEAQLAAADLAVVRSENLVIVTEANLRTLMHSSEDEVFALGEDLESEVPKLTGDLKTMRAAALAKRPELKAIDAQVSASESNVAVINAGMYPRLDAIGNLTYANPNTRIFPQEEKFRTTWDVSLQLTWSPNDALVAKDNKSVASANVATLKETRGQLEDALALDVINAFTKVREAEAAVVSTAAERKASEEAYRVRLEQFRAGIAVSSLLIDSESDVTRGRLNELNARVELRISRVQLKRATGEY